MYGRSKSPHELENEAMDFWLEMQRVHKANRPRYKAEIKAIVGDKLNDEEIEKILDIMAR